MPKTTSLNSDLEISKNACNSVILLKPWNSYHILLDTNSISVDYYALTVSIVFPGLNNIAYRVFRYWMVISMGS